MLVGVFPGKADLEVLQCSMPGAPGDPWPLMPQTPARAIHGVRLEHDHGAHLSGSCVLSPTTYCRPHHRLARSAGWRESAHGPLDMVTQRGYSRRSVAHIAADLRGQPRP